MKIFWLLLNFTFYIYVHVLHFYTGNPDQNAASQSILGLDPPLFQVTIRLHFRT